MAATPTFRFVEYEGEDAADVLVGLLMNLKHGGPGGDEEHEVTSETERVIGFQPNPKDEGGEEDEDE